MHPNQKQKGLKTFPLLFTPIHEVVPNAVRIADIIDASICNDHLNTSFLPNEVTTIYQHQGHPAPFSALYSASGFIGNKPGVSLRETPTLFTTNPRLHDAFTLSHFHFSVSGFHIPAKKSY